jgi:thymidylate kinase
MDVDPEESLKRLSLRDEKKEMFENINALTKVREKQLSLAKDWHIINTCDSIEDVQRQIEVILDHLDKEV